MAADRHPLLARQRRYYRVPALVRRLPGGHLPGPGGPDPAADDASASAGVTAGSGAAVATVAAPTAPTRAPLVPVAAAPPRATDAPAALSCRDAPGPAGAPSIIGGGTPAAPATPVPSDAPTHVSPGPVRLSATQRAVLDALAECGRPTATISSTELSEWAGINRSTVRAALRELRVKLGIDQDEDLVAAARGRATCGWRHASRMMSDT